MKTMKRSRTTPPRQMLRASSAALRKTDVNLCDRLGLSLCDPRALIKEIQGGLLVTVIDALAKVMDVSILQLARGVVISERTLARRKTEGRLHVDESDRVARLALLFNDAVKLFDGDVGRAASWFHAPNSALGGLAPFVYADTEPGAQEVRDLIGRIEHGVFS